MSKVHHFAVIFENVSIHYKELFEIDVCPRDLIVKFMRDFHKENVNIDDYSLIVHIKDESPIYLKESNFNCLQKMYMMDLCLKVEKEVSEMKTHLSLKDIEMAKKILDCLAKRLMVEEFVRHCIDQSFHMELFKLVEKVVSNDELAALTLKVFSELVVYTSRKEDIDEIEDRPYISWHNIKPETIRATLEYCKTTQNIKGIDSALKVLVRYVCQNENLRDSIFKNLDSTFIFSLFERLHKNTIILKPLKCSIQISLISLINCLFWTIREAKELFISKLKDYFAADNIRILKENVDIISRKLKEFPSGLPPDGCNEPTKEELDLIQELIKLQYFILLPIHWDLIDNNYEGPKIQDLELFKQIVSGSENDSDSEIFEKLGFQNPLNPSKDFVESPGHLVFNCVKYFILRYYDELVGLFNKIAGFSNFNIIKIASSLVKILDRALLLSQVVDENMDGGIFLPFIFHCCEMNDDLSKYCFYEMFYKCFNFYANSLVDVKFKSDDPEFEESFVNQINEVLNCYPSTIHEFSLWLGKVKTEIVRKKKLEAQIMEWEHNQHVQNPIINHLRNELKSEYEGIVNKKRIRQLQERPYSFDLRSSKSIQKYSLQLDDSQSVIIAREESDPNSKANKWPISNIKNISTDRDNTNFQRKDNAFSFSITMEFRDESRDDPPNQTKTFNFACNNKKHFAIWMDGLNILINKIPTSNEFKDEISDLVRMEMKIRFLLLSKDNIPHEPPIIPTLPNNYDFLD